MNRAKNQFGAAHQGRPRRIQEFIPNDGDAPVLHRRNIPPGRIFQRRGRLRARSRGGPRKDNHIRIRSRDLRIRNAAARRHHHSSTGQRNQFCDPRRRADPRMGPNLAINARRRPGANFSRALRYALECALHSRNEFFSCPGAPREPRESADVAFDIAKRARIERQKRHRLFQNAFDNCRGEWHRADQKRRLEAHHRGDIHLPAVAEFWPPANGRYVFAPLRHADHFAPGAKANENRRDAWSESNNPLAWHARTF